MEHESTLYYNAVIHTMDESLPLAEALLTNNGRIAAIGTLDNVTAQTRVGTRRVDLDGQTIVPGFNDCHCHILAFGLTLEQIDVGPDAVRTIEDIKSVVTRRARETSKGQWVIGRGYDQNVLEDRRHPTRQDLDEAGHGLPVILRHTSGHAVTCNSRALELACINAETDTPPGGDIERDEHGIPNGVLKESAMDLLEDAVPPPTHAVGRDAIREAMHVMATQGITSASDAATGSGSSIGPALEMYRAAVDGWEIAGRITIMPQISYVAPPQTDAVYSPREFDAGGQPEWLALGPTKIFTDGALTTRTAALREPYADSSDNRGLLIWEYDVLRDMVLRAHRSGWQIATHAIGDRAVQIALDCYEAALLSSPRSNHRHRIEHCMLLDEALAVRMRDAGVVPVVQPGFVSRLGDAYIAGLGIERASQVMPMGLFKRLGIPAAFSSDRPVIPGLPVQGLLAASTRSTPRGVTLGGEHRVTLRDGVRLYSAGGAFATHTESVKGTLKRDMYADFVVFSGDPIATPVENIGDLRITMTVVGGREVFTTA